MFSFLDEVKNHNHTECCSRFVCVSVCVGGWGVGGRCQLDSGPATGHLCEALGEKKNNQTRQQSRSLNAKLTKYVLRLVAAWPTNDN